MNTNNKKVEKEKDKFDLVLVILSIFAICIGVYSYIQTEKSCIITKMEKNYSLINSSEIEPIVHKDTTDYYVTINTYSVGHLTLFVSKFDSKDNQEKIYNDVILNKNIMGHYTHINDQWYINNASKVNIPQNEAIREINEIVKAINTTLIERDKIKQSWEK